MFCVILNLTLLTPGCVNICLNSLSVKPGHSQLASYFGITLAESYSGNSINKKGVISRMGSPRVRAILYMCEASALRCNPMVGAMNARMSKNGKHIMKIIIAAMNKLIRQVFGVLK
jgi:transposase